MKSSDTQIIPVIRWMIRRDLKSVASIEQQAFEFPCTADEFLTALRQHNCIAMIAEHQEIVIGYVVYELAKSQLRILNLAVDPAYQRCGIGRQIMKKMFNKLSQQQRTEIVCEVRETNLAAQLFFRSMGLAVHQVNRKPFDDTDEDGYEFRYQIKSTECETKWANSRR